MTASRLAIVQTDLDQLITQIDMAEQHQRDLETRVHRLRSNRPCKGAGIQGVLGRFYNPTQNFTDMSNSKNLGFEEVVDTLSDAIRLFDRVDNVLADGIQFMDAMVILSEFPTLQELYNDRKLFSAELRDLNADESSNVYEQVAANTGTAKGKVATRAKAALDFAADAYALVEDTIVRGKRILEKAKAIVA
jgi:uncharacterized protein YerC